MGATDPRAPRCKARVADTGNERVDVCGALVVDGRCSAAPEHDTGASAARSEVPDKPNARIVCAGQRVSTKEKPFWAWYTLDPRGHPFGESIGFRGKSLREGVGMVFEAYRSEDGVTWRKGKYVGVLDSPDATELCAQWRAEEQAARVSIRMAVTLRKGKDTDWIGELVGPLRKAYLCADPIGREVILATVLRKITRGA